VTSNIDLDVDVMKQKTLAITHKYVTGCLDPGDEKDVRNAIYWAASDGYQAGLHAASSLEVGVQNRLQDDGISALTSEMCCQAIAAHEALEKLKLQSD
jgi:hypothetical protein